MKYSLPLFILGFLFLPVGGVTDVQDTVIAEWDVTDINNFGVSPLEPATKNENVIVVGLTRSESLMTTATSSAISGWGSNSLSLIPDAGEKPYDDRVDEAIRQGKYFTFAIRPKENKEISFTEIPEHKLRRSKDGPKRFRWQYKVGNGEFLDLLDKGASASSIGTLIPTIKLSNYPDLQNTTEEVTFRIIPYNASRSGGIGNIFDCVLQVKGNIN